MLKDSPAVGSGLRFLALISDVHGNIDALEAVLEDMRVFPVRGMACLGDVVGYGAEPGACLQRVMETCGVTLLGNHETILCYMEKFPEEEIPPVVGAPIRLALSQLTDKQKEFARSLPLVVNGDGLTLSHSSLDDPGDFRYILSRPEARAHFLWQETPVSFQGHTHVPVIWESDAAGKIRIFEPTDGVVQLDRACRYAINVGSVGQPRDGDSRACYVLFDPQQFVVLFRRVTYDIRRAQERIRSAGLPRQNADRLKEGK